MICTENGCAAVKSTGLQIVSTVGGCIAAIAISMTPTVQPERIFSSIKNNPFSISLTSQSSNSITYDGLMVSRDLEVAATRLENNLQKLDMIKSFEMNWNGYGAQPFSTIFIESICDLVKNLERQPEVFPTAQESIQFEYDKDNGDYLELEIFEDGTVRMFVLSCEGEAKEAFITKDTINRVVEEFYGQ